MKYKQFIIHALIAFGIAGGSLGCGIDEEAPVITRAELVVDSDNALRATIEVETDVPTALTIEVYGPDLDPWIIPLPETQSVLHQVPLLGLRAETRYELVITATSADMGAAMSDDALEFITDPLPDDFPPLTTSVPLPERVSPGITIVGIARLGQVGFDDSWGYIVGVDQAGEVVWYQPLDSDVGDLRQMTTGNLLYMKREGTIVEMDFMGTVVTEIAPQDVGMDSFHHDIVELPDGNFLALSSELRQIDGYQDDDGNPVSYEVVGDIIVEFDRQGTIINQVHLFDLLDPLRIVSPDFHFNFWDRLYDKTGTKDWTHSNAVILDPSDNSYIVSLRHQDWIIKIDRDTGDLVWKLGAEGDFTMMDGGEFSYHQHAPEIQENGTLLVYDNGNGRPTVGDNEIPNTRVVEFELDENLKTVRQVWAYYGEESYFTPVSGDADRLSNGNVLICNSTMLTDPTLSPFDPANLTFSRIFEVTYADDPEPAFEIVIRDDSDADPQGYVVYRAERIDSLYPPVQ